MTTVPAQHSRLRETALTDQARQHGRNLVESPARSDEKTHSRPKRATFRSIGLDAPDWWSPLPPTVAAAVDVFDRRHAMLSARATAALEGAAQGDHPFERAARFEAALLAVQRHRYALPQKVRQQQKIEVRPKTAPVRRTWRLDESIWAPRQRTSESRAFYDTAALRRRMFECDWARALQANRGSLTKHILRHAWELRDRVARSVFVPFFVPTAEQLADILTKALRPGTHSALLARLLHRVVH